MSRIRQEINMLCGQLNAFTSNGITTFDPASFSGTVTAYFEVIARGVSTVSLRVSGSATDTATITPTDSVNYARYRVSFTLPAGVTSWTIVSSSTVKAARIILLQDTTTSTINTQTQIEIGNQELMSAYAFTTPLLAPKYWYYDSSKWDGTATFEAEVCGRRESAMSTSSWFLEEDNGTMTSWTTKATIVSATTAIVPTRWKVNFIPVNGRTYRVSNTNSDTMNGGCITYTAKIIVTQTEATKFEPQYLLLNTSSSSVGYQDVDTLYDPTEWDGVTQTVYHETNTNTSASNVSAESVWTYTSGTTSWVAPSNATSVEVECWGGGGGGGSISTVISCGGGGGGGAYAKKTVAVTPGASYTVSVGGGGSGSTDGNPSWFLSTSEVFAAGGKGGLANATTAGAGGLATDSIGTTKFSGADGVPGLANTYGGGGGSSAGIAANGNVGSTNLGGTAPTGGGSGGNGAGSAGSGSSGGAPGGGGGGAMRLSTGNRAGGAGGNGKIVITHVLSAVTGSGRQRSAAIALPTNVSVIYDSDVVTS